MLVCKINPLKPERGIINKAVTILKKGGVVVFPTETAYGLAADFFNKEAVEKVFKIKKRPRNKKLTLIAADVKMVKRYFYLNKTEEKLAKTYWPGPLTLILKIKGGGSREFGIRVSSNEIAKLLSEKLGRPITATSANLSGKAECYSTKSVIEQFIKQKHQPDFILDSGKLCKRRVSTIVRVSGNNKIVIIRQGAIKIKSNRLTKN